MQKNKARPYPTLFNNVSFITSSGELSIVVGDYFEEACLKLLRLTRLCINSTQEVCPDLCNEDRTLYVESKASNLSSNGIAIKKDQVHCYRDLIDLNFPDIHDPKPVFKISLKYCLWFYEAKLDSNDVEDLRDTLSCSIRSCIILDFEHIYNLMKDSDVQVHKRFREAAILKYAKQFKTRKSMRTLNVYDKETLNFPVIEVL